ncbi:hypothetical protein FB45DRAFT_1148855 [Roridomyces roridus]|uniref:Uncharacterized protein n=1 Tax=Roridomyces roridus TaxID=1738132 RepID=A0AAD7FN97_9AGAR|nr:hypothetical protein FB45DRAFT_1148855 [Roridomyces roridus]
MRSRAPALPPTAQLASSNPRAWDEQWEIYFADSALAHAATPTWFLEDWHVQLRASNLSSYEPTERDNIIQHTRSFRNTLCGIQMDMTRIAAPYFVGQALQRRWMSATPQKRGELILAGLVYTCTVSTTLHQARSYCEREMDAEAHRRDGRLFIDLLEEIMVQNPTESGPGSPTYVSHAVWDALVADQQASTDKKLALTVILAERNMLIGESLLYCNRSFAGFVIYFTLCSFLKLPIPQLNSSKGRHKPVKAKYSVNPRLQDELRMAYGDEVAKGITKVAMENGKGICIQAKEVYAKGKQIYTHAANGAGIKWKEKSYTALRSECQKIDWKAGHKKECGKWLKLEDLTPSTAEQHSSQIGPPLDGFKRSGALICQVAKLNKLSPEYDYMIFLGYDCVYVSFPHPPIRAAFRACRNKALTTGDPTRDRAMLGQILEEFDFPEILLAVTEMEMLMHLDAGGRPPLIVDAGVSAAEWKAIPSAWVDVGIVPR